MRVRITNDTTPLGTNGDPRSRNRVRARHFPGAGDIKRKQDMTELNFGSLNVGTMKHKSHEIEDMMIRRRINIMCVQEVKWKNARRTQEERPDS